MNQETRINPLAPNRWNLMVSSQFCPSLSFILNLVFTVQLWWPFMSFHLCLVPVSVCGRDTMSIPESLTGTYEIPPN